MKVTNAGFFERTAKLSFVVGELHSMSHKDVACATNARACSVAVLRDLISRSSHHERGTCTDIEGVLSIATSPDDIKRFIRSEVDMFARFEQTIPQAEQFFYCRASRLQSHQHSRNLFDWIAFASDAYQNVVHVLPRKRFAGNESL